MEIVRHHLHGEPAPAAKRIPVPANREMLAKRRWRGVAEDGAEFGFDLDHLLADGDGVFATSTAHYFIEQTPEPVIEIPLGDNPAAAAQLGWKIGNLHFSIEVTSSTLRVADDSAIRQMLEREEIDFAATTAVFRPLHSAPHSHGHSHD